MLEASLIDAQSHLHELPVKSPFEQIHRVSEFGGLNRFACTTRGE